MEYRGPTDSEGDDGTPGAPEKGTGATAAATELARRRRQLNWRSSGGTKPSPAVGVAVAGAAPALARTAGVGVRACVLVRVMGQARGRQESTASAT